MEAPLMAEYFCKNTEVLTSFYNTGNTVVCHTARMELYSCARGSVRTSEIMSPEQANHAMFNLQLATNQLPPSLGYDWDQHQW